MITAKPFTWVVAFTVAPMWVQDGFTISHDRAQGMLAKAVNGATNDEISAMVLEAPSPLQIVRMQGYGPKNPRSGVVAREIWQGTQGSGEVRNALVAARKLLDSAAFVSKEGDTVATLSKIDAALALLDARQGEPVEIEA